MAPHYKCEKYSFYKNQTGGGSKYDSKFGYIKNAAVAAKRKKDGKISE